MIKKLAKRKGIPVKVIDVDDCGKKCEGITQVPTIYLDGREVTDLNELARILQ